MPFIIRQILKFIAGEVIISAILPSPELHEEPYYYEDPTPVVNEHIIEEEPFLDYESILAPDEYLSHYQITSNKINGDDLETTMVGLVDEAHYAIHINPHIDTYHSDTVYFDYRLVDLESTQKLVSSTKMGFILANEGEGLNPIVLEWKDEPISGTAIKYEDQRTDKTYILIVIDDQNGQVLFYDKTLNQLNRP